MQKREDAKDWDGAIACLHELLNHPCAHHQVTVYEVWNDIYELHTREGDFDAAIAAKQAAIDAGYLSDPDPEADIAECQLLAGRRAEADALFADLRARTPDDVWLYNSAGFAYAMISDHRESARWFREGIEVALRTGDPDQIVVQLLDGLEAAWRKLGETPEPGVNDRVEAFVDAWERPADPFWQRWHDLPRLERRQCEHCGYDPEALDRSDPDIDGREAIWEESSTRPTPRHASSMVVGLAWFPRGEWEKATTTWPDLLECLPADHGEYSHRIEARLKFLARNLVGHPIRVSAMSVGGLTDFCKQEGDDPGTGEARSRYAAELARRGDVLPWPPRRNVPCWCGSGRKYKTCCGPIPTVPE